MEDSDFLLYCTNHVKSMQLNDAISLIPKEIKFGIEFLGEKHLKSNMKRSFDTLEGHITDSNEEKVNWK